MTGKELKEAMQRTERIYSTLITVTDPKWIDTFKSMGLDFVFIDMEHIPINLRDVSTLCHQFSSMDTAPVVRIPDPDPYKACVALDAGATGILAPYIETEDQVRNLIGAVKYKPLKGQKLEQFLIGETRLEDKLLDYLNDKNQDNVLFINIESLSAVENLDKLLSFPELDGIIIGPHDLSCSLGIPEEYENPLFLETVDRIIKIAVKHKKSVGYHKGYAAGDTEQMIQWAEQGMNILIHEGDLIAAGSKLNNDIAHMRKRLNDDKKIDHETLNI